MIAAVARNGVIGHDGAMPWRLPGDLRHFRDATMGKPVIVGRKTFEAIGRPLSGRSLIVLSRDPSFQVDGARTVRSTDAAVAEAQRICREHGASDIMVAGGAAIYAALIPRADLLLVTEVDLSPAGDAWFPPIDPATWVLTERQAAPATADDEASYAFSRYSRRKAGSVAPRLS